MKTKLEFNEIIAICLHKLGKKPNVTTFIDERTLMFGYGKLNGNIGIWQYNLPRYYVLKNIFKQK